MRRLITHVTFWLAVSSPGFALATAPPTWGDLQPGDHEVGFTLVEAVDGSRTIRPAGGGGAAHPRPVRLWLWYPASGPAEVMTFARYVELADGDVWPEEMLSGARERMRFAARPLARSLGPERYSALLDEPLAAAENAPAAAGRHPLVVVGQGLYYESPITHAAFCEYLASHGFVVVSPPLLGTHSPLVNLDVVDLETQVRDMEVAVSRARELAFVSPDRLGAFGFDMGGMAALILAMRNPDVDALVTTDAAVLFGHPAGIPVDSPHYEPDLLRCPWLHATQRRFGTRPPDHDGPDLFAEAVHADRYLLLTDGMNHCDFTSCTLIEDRNPVMGYWPPREGGEKEGYEAVCRAVERFLAAQLLDDPAAREHLGQAPKVAPPGSPCSLEHLPAVPPDPTWPDLLNALASGEMDRAAEVARSLQESDASSPLLDEARLNRLGYHLLAGWQLFDAAGFVLELNVKLHPDSVNVYDSMGEYAMITGDREAALRWFGEVLRRDPDNRRAQETIDRLTR